MCTRGERCGPKCVRNSTSGFHARIRSVLVPPGLQVDVGRRRRRQHDAPARAADAGRVADERDRRRAAEVAHMVRRVAWRPGRLELVADDLERVVLAEHAQRDRRARPGPRPTGDPCPRRTVATRSRAASTDRPDAARRVRARTPARPGTRSTSVPVAPAWSRWMCVSRIARTSANARPLSASLARSAGSVVDGPGSMSATPARRAESPVAMMPGWPRNSRSM